MGARTADGDDTGEAARQMAEIMTKRERAAAPGDARVALPARLLDAIRDHAIFALDEGGAMVSWSDGARQVTGYDEDEVLGQSYSVFSAQANDAETARMLQMARNTGAFQQERWWRKRDAGLVWVHEQIQPMPGGGFVVIARDLTERVEADERRLAADDRQEASARREAAGLAREAAGLAREEEGRTREADAERRERLLRTELQAAERRAAFLAEASSILVATSLDFDSTLRALARLAVSRVADWCAIHALDERGSLVPADVAHRDPRIEASLHDTIDRALSAKWRQTVESVISTGQSQILSRTAASGWLEPVTTQQVESAAELGTGSAMITPLLGRGRVLGAITFVTMDPERDYDEEDLVLAEELGRRAAIALDNARLYRDAQEANRAKADFLAVMSHELRTPLNAIMGYSDLLDAEVSGELSDKQRRQIDRIRASARHLLQLIEEILSFARIESGGEEVRLAIAEAREIVEEAAAIAEPLAQAKGLDFRVEDGVGITLETDPHKVRQILINLLSNAVKFTERGTVTLRVRTEDEAVLFDVIDTGIGIPAEQVDRIFDPFWQVERPNTRRAGGTGLGLSVSRRYVRLLRGEIIVQSEPGRGTCFTVRLPLRITGEHAS